MPDSRLTRLRRALIRGRNRVEVVQIRLVGTSVVGLGARTPVAVVATRGRRTGRWRATPVAVLPLAPADVNRLVASAGGPGRGPRPAGSRLGGSRLAGPMATTGPPAAFLVAGGAAGQARLPDWVANLRASPGGQLVYRRRRLAVRACELIGEAHAEGWARAVETWPRLERYRRWAGRPTPLFVLVVDGGDQVRPRPAQ